MTIKPKPLTITADSDTKTYDGTPLTKNSYTNTALATDDTFTSVTISGSQTVKGSSANVPSAAVIKKGDEDRTACYDITYSNGTLTINPASLMITAKDCEIVFGEEPENNGVTYSGFVNNETESVLTGTLSYSYNSAANGSGDPYTTTSPMGTYYIIPSGVSNGNYTITFVEGLLIVGKKKIGQDNGHDIADGFTVSYDDAGHIILKDGDTPLIEGTDFEVQEEELSASGRYSVITIKCKDTSPNYQGQFTIRTAIVDFSTDADGVEYSATFVAEGNHVLPDGIKAYIITAIEGDWAIPQPLTYIPNGEPVLLLSEEDVNGFKVEQKNDPPGITGTNWLKKVTSETPGYVTTEGENYHKALFESRAIYLLYKNEFVLNKRGYLAEGKVYLSKTDPTNPAPSLRIAWDMVDGIDNSQCTIHNSQFEGTWHTLDGRPLNRKPSQKGLYIQNGRKVAVK